MVPYCSAEAYLAQNQVVFLLPDAVLCELVRPRTTHIVRILSCCESTPGKACPMVVQQDMKSIPASAAPLVSLRPSCSQSKLFASAQNPDPVCVMFFFLFSHVFCCQRCGEHHGQGKRSRPLGHPCGVLHPPRDCHGWPYRGAGEGKGDVI